MDGRLASTSGSFKFLPFYYYANAYTFLSFVLVCMIINMILTAAPGVIVVLSGVRTNDDMGIWQRISRRSYCPS